jgi:hypothetical protein
MPSCGAVAVAKRVGSVHERTQQRAVSMHLAAYWENFGKFSENRVVCE